MSSTSHISLESIAPVVQELQGKLVQAGNEISSQRALLEAAKGEMQNISQELAQAKAQLQNRAPGTIKANKPPS